MNLIVKPLSPDIIDDYLSFFDNMVFSENPDWSQCYCYSYHFNGAEEEWEKEKNRSSVIELINEGKMRGYLAYDSDKPVGWCNANNRNNYQALSRDDIHQSKLCSIVCFLISPIFRRKGIAQKMLEQVIYDYKMKSFDYIEAYPRKEQHSCEGNYHGHLSLYEKFDFTVEKEFDDYYLVRRRLKSQLS